MPILSPKAQAEQAARQQRQKDLVTFEQWVLRTSHMLMNAGEAMLDAARDGNPRRQRGDKAFFILENLLPKLDATEARAAYERLMAAERGDLPDGNT